MTDIIEVINLVGLGLVGGIVVTLLLMLIPTISAYKNTVEEKKKKQIKKDIREMVVSFLSLVIVLAGLITWHVFYNKETKNYEYKEVTSVAESVETLYEVHIDKIIAEKDVEPIYYITLSNNKINVPGSDTFFLKKKNHPLYRRNGICSILSDNISLPFLSSMLRFDNIELILSETECNSIVGIGNNHLRMNVHILTLDTEEFHGKGHSVVLYRLGCFGEAFSEEEVAKFSEQFLAAANARDCEGEFSDGVSADFVVIHY